MRPEDYIYVSSWERLCQSLGENIIYTATEHAPEVFRQLAGTGKRRVLVTGCSDYTLCEQGEHHPNEDLFKLASSVDWLELSRERSAYRWTPIGPACNPSKCNPAHRYSLKTERFTWETFEDLPDEVVCWFTTNANVKHPRVQLIPFGLNTDGPGSSYIPAIAGRPQEQRLYVNFQDNSLERVQLKRYYSRLREEHWVVYRPEANIPVQTYLEEMAGCRFVLCPAGNGVDCYRVWEALYLGCYPVLGVSEFSRRLMEMHLPVVVVDNLFGITPDLLEQARKMFAMNPFSLAAADVNTWARLIEKEVEECC